MSDVSTPDPPTGGPSSVVLEALSREDGDNSTVRIYRDRIEWVKKRSISSMPRAKDDPPVIPIASISAVRAKKDGPLFSRVILRTEFGMITFRMHSPQAVEVRDTIADLMAANPAPFDVDALVPAAPPAEAPADPAADDLAQLQWLRDEGMLTTEQFEAAKASLEAG